MTVVIIGAGNVATVFGRLIIKAGHEVIQLVSRNIANARILANELGCGYTNDLKNSDSQADVYVVAVTDSALHEIGQSFFLGNKLVVHTAGSVSKDILKMVSGHYGVIYPLQSLRKEHPQINHDIPLLIDGSSATVIDLIREFALTLSPMVEEADDEQRLKLHIAAVFVNNFTNHLYSLAAGYCSKEGLDFKMLQPLIEETALRLRHHDPREMQTGPAIREDVITIEKHTRLLAQYPELKEMYRVMSQNILNAKPGNVNRQ